MGPAKSSDEVPCPSCGGTVEILDTDASGQRSGMCSYCYATVTVDARGRAALANSGRADKAEETEEPKKTPKAEKPKPPDPATIVRAVLADAGIVAEGESKVTPGAKLEPLSADQVRLVGRIGTHVSYFRRSDEAEIAEAFAGLTEAVTLGGELNQLMRSDALELIEELSRQASLPEQDRFGTAVLKSVLIGLGSTFVGARSLAEAWRSASRPIESFFEVG